MANGDEPDVEFKPLPPQPAPTASYGERDYYRRRVDELLDDRIRGIAHTVNTLDGRVDGIDSKLSRVFGGLAVIVFLATIIGPVIVRWLTGQP
jgi:hypothetical protein